MAEAVICKSLGELYRHILKNETLNNNIKIVPKTDDLKLTNLKAHIIKGWGLVDFYLQQERTKRFPGNIWFMDSREKLQEQMGSLLKNADKYPVKEIGAKLSYQPTSGILKLTAYEIAFNSGDNLVFRGYL